MDPAAPKREVINAPDETTEGVETSGGDVIVLVGTAKGLFSLTADSVRDTWEDGRALVQRMGTYADGLDSSSPSG